jgi:putative membrane protein
MLKVPSAIGLVTAAAVCTLAIDVVVDPIALRGGQWFLGNLYRYEGPGQWFGVPLGNFGGWLLVSMVVTAADLLLSRRRTERAGYRGALLATAVLVFNASVGLAIGAPGAVFASLALSIAILLGVAVGARLHPFGGGGVAAVRPEHARRSRKER